MKLILKKTKFNLFPLVLLSYAVLFYLLATGHTGWYFYVGLGFLLLERLLIAFSLWMTTMIAKQAMASILEQAMTKQGLNLPPDDPTLGPIQGGSIDPQGD